MAKVKPETEKSKLELLAPDDIKGLRIKLEAFQKQINQSPTKVKTHKNQGFKYVPIDNVKKQLAKNFFGLTQVKNFRWERIGNEIVGAIELWYVHPTTNQWMMQEGAAALIIRQREKTKLSDFMNEKLKNALVLDFPHLKAECVKNAAMEIGDLFGGNLRRDYQEEYTGFYKDEVKAPDLTKEQKEWWDEATFDLLAYEDSDELREKQSMFLEQAKEIKLPPFYMKQLETMIQETFDKLNRSKK